MGGQGLDVGDFGAVEKCHSYRLQAQTECMKSKLQV